jgi:hypothetical protein
VVWLNAPWPPLSTDCHRPREDLAVVGEARRRIVEGRAPQAHRPASFGDGEAAGPVMTDGLALLGRGALRTAPLTQTRISVQRLTREVLLRSLPLELNAVRSVLRHGFHPLKAWHPGQFSALDISATGGALQGQEERLTAHPPR